MSIILLAILFSDPAHHSNLVQSYRVDDSSSMALSIAPNDHKPDWRIGRNGWEDSRGECPAFFKRELEGVGALEVRSMCNSNESFTPHVGPYDKR